MASGQLPEEFTNLQVLPRDIAQQELIGTMRGFALGLGVRCEHCHVGEPGAPLSSFDFAADDKPTKRTARVMLQMTRTINNEHLDGVVDELRTGLEVRCVTCHRGQPRPALIEDVLDRALEEGGAEAAVAKYRQLRDEFYGGHSFDFSDLTLVLYAQGLVGRGQPAAAMALAELSVEYAPDSFMAHHLLGALLAESGEREEAIRHLERSLEINPQNPRARQQLDRLRQSGETEEEGEGGPG